MTQPVQDPTGNYKRPLEGPLLTCPHCNKILNQHFAPGAVQGAANVDSIPDSGIVDLPGRAVPPPEPVPQALVDSGDVFIPDPSPQVIRRPEQVKTGQARPEKGRGHVIHGMTPKQTPATPPPPQHAQAGALSVLDHPVIGGKVTIVVCCYGEEHENLHRRCLNSIVKTVPPSRMDLRIIANQVGVGSTNYFNALPYTKIYPDYKHRRKYPAMRQVFWDKEQPIDTNFVIWFDDDSYVRNEAWLSVLAQVITTQRPADRVGMYGFKMFHPLQRPDPRKDPRAWFRNAAWHKGLDFRNANGRSAPNGNKVHFVVGGFWAISTECIRAADIPDTRLNHNGGDITIGEQIYQAGYKMKQFNENKQYVHTSAAPRRGFKEKFPWYR